MTADRPMSARVGVRGDSTAAGCRCLRGVLAGVLASILAGVLAGVAANLRKQPLLKHPWIPKGLALDALFRLLVVERNGVNRLVDLGQDG